MAHRRNTDYVRRSRSVGTGMKASSSLLSVIAVALTGCTPPVVPDVQKRPEEMRAGLSESQVNRLLGAPTRSCWNYVRTKDSDTDYICFTKGIVEYVETRRPVPGTRDIDVQIMEGDRPSPPPSSPATKAALGMTIAEVARLMGNPPMREEYYFKGRAEYYAIFRNGIVTKFAPVAYCSRHGVTHRVPASETANDDCYPSVPG